MASSLLANTTRVIRYGELYSLHALQTRRLDAMAGLSPGKTEKIESRSSGGREEGLSPMSEIKASPDEVS